MKEIFIGTRPTHDRLVGLLEDRSRRRENFGSPACTRWSVWSTAHRAAGR
jgi:hypothetical protein